MHLAFTGGIVRPNVYGLQPEPRGRHTGDFKQFHYHRADDFDFDQARQQGDCEDVP